MFELIQDYGYENEETIKTLSPDNLDQYCADNDFFMYEDGIYTNGHLWLVSVDW